MHIIHIVISDMPADYDPGDVHSSDNELRRLIKNTNFLPIAKEQLYYPGVDAPVINKDGVYFLNSWRKPACIPRVFSSIEEARSHDGSAPSSSTFSSCWQTNIWISTTPRAKQAT